MGLLEGKKGLIFGLANQWSIAWGISEALHKEGARLAFTYLNDSLAKRVIPLAQSLNAEHVTQCDVQSDADIDRTFNEIQEKWGEIDFVIHSVAFANGEDLKNPFSQTSREGFKLAMDVSAYSLVAVTNRAIPLMKNGGSIVTLSYLGAARVVPNYRVMGVAKAALEASVRELAAELGPQNIRVNAISAGPIKTLAASGIANFRGLMSSFEARAPMKRVVTIEEVGLNTVYLLSNYSSGVTGEVLYVDAGFNITV